MNQEEEAEVTEIEPLEALLKRNTLETKKAIGNVNAKHGISLVEENALNAKWKNLKTP